MDLLARGTPGRRQVTPVVMTTDRAVSVPPSALIDGFATSHFGLHDTALAYFVLTTPALNRRSL